MPIDTSIYNALSRPRSVADYAADYDEQDLRQQRLQANALALQTGRQKADEYGRGVREQEIVRNALAQQGSGATDEQRYGAMYGTGTGYGMAQAEALRKSMLDQQKTRSEAASKNSGLLKQYSTILTQSPTQATAMALLNHYETTTGERADEIRGILQQAGDNPDMLRKIAFALSTEGGNLLPKTEIRNLGGTDQAVTTDAFGGTTMGQSFAKTAGPDARLQAGTAAARLAFDREKLGADQAAASAPKPGAAPSPASAKVLDAREAIAIINQAEPLLKDSTSSGIGWAVDKLAQAFGAATPGAINAQALKVLEGNLVAKMPKMSGPQSDKDVALYRQMAAVIGDETIPYLQKAAALQTVREIQERYAGMAPGSSNTGRKVSGTVTPSAPAQAGAVVEWGSLK
jgi:hypothetical protein